MSQCLFTLSLENPHDLIRSRQLVRHAAELLGFDARDRSCLAAAAFDLACHAHAVAGHASICCEVIEDCFRVVCKPMLNARSILEPDTSRSFRVGKPLPSTAAVSRDDVPWMIKQMIELAPVNPFEEVKKVNEELLRALLESAQHRGSQADYAGPSAA